MVQRDGAKCAFQRNIFQFESTVEQLCEPGELLDDSKPHLPVGNGNCHTYSQDYYRRKFCM